MIPGVYVCVGIPSAKSGVEPEEPSGISLATIIVAVIVGILLVSPLIACYVLWFKYHRTRELPDAVEEVYETFWDRL